MSPRATRTVAPQWSPGTVAVVNHDSSSPTASIRPVVVYADGSALGNPGPTGWAWWVSPSCWASGGLGHGTNNIGELTAVVEILTSFPADTPLELRCDSRYAISCCTEWLAGWKRRGWVKADGKPVANREIIERLDGLLARRTATTRFVWVKAHAGEPGNEAVDTLARGAAERSGRGDHTTLRS